MVKILLASKLITISVSVDIDIILKFTFYNLMIMVYYTIGDINQAFRKNLENIFLNTICKQLILINSYNTPRGFPYSFNT